MEDDLKFPQDIFSEDAQDILKLILKKDALERPSLEEIKSHRFFSNYEKVLDFNSIKPEQEEKQLYMIRKQALQKEFKLL